MPSSMWKKIIKHLEIFKHQVQIPSYFPGHKWGFKFPSGSKKPVFPSWLKKVSKVVYLDGDPGTQNCIQKYIYFL